MEFSVLVSTPDDGLFSEVAELLEGTNLERTRPTSRNAIDSMAVVTFVVGAIGGGVTYDLLKVSVLAVYQRIRANAFSGPVKLELQNDDVQLEADEFNVVFVDKTGAETAVNIERGIEMVLENEQGTDDVS